MSKNASLRRIGCMLVVLAMVLSLMPGALAAGEDVTVLLKPNDSWKEGDARFAVYYFDSEGTGWRDLTDAGDGYYEVAVPAGVTVIFCRMNPATTDNDWGNKWNQSGNLTLPTDGKNCYVIPKGEWDGFGDANWYVKGEEPGEEPAGPTVYTVAGDEGLCGTGWEPKLNPMTQQDTGLWAITLPGIEAGSYEFKVTDGSWGASWGRPEGGNYPLTVSEASNVTITFDPETKEIAVTMEPVQTTPDPDPKPDPEPVTYTVAGSGGLCGEDWKPELNPMTLGEDGKHTITFQNVPAGSYEFKVTDGSWNNAWGKNGGNYPLSLEKASNVTITFDPETKAITVDIQAVETTPDPDPEPEVPTSYTVKLHFLPSEDWGEAINAWVWTGEGDAVAGYEEYHLSWPGKAIDANADHAGWYDLTVVTQAADGFKFIFNDGSNQTLDLSTGKLTGDLELWYVGQSRHTTAPEEWTGVPTYTFTVHFNNAAGWQSVNAYAWLGADKLLGDWPGTGVAQNQDNAGWYDVKLTVPANALGIIFNGDGSQTGDLNLEAPGEERNVEVWILGDETVSYAAPEGWVEGKAGNTVKLHFMPPYMSWGTDINAWIWAGGSDVPGYEEYHQSWPGKLVQEDPEYPGWYYLEITTELPGFSFIFNGNGSQTADLSTGEIVGDLELWVYGNEIYTSAPATTPRTGDGMNLTLCVAVMVFSALALALVVSKKKHIA